MRQSSEINIIAGETISVEINDRDENGNKIPLRADKITSRIYKMPYKDPIDFLGEVPQDSGVVLIPSNVTEKLSGRYIIRIRINNNNFIQIRDIKLEVES